ncbi:hypothetical protein DFH09DRAFT_1334057 [Mycena vulgaris]|nr:hypothetical protein DFH09DRAFT_1334057 [Mycena vulgaris]
MDPDDLKLQKGATTPMSCLKSTHALSIGQSTSQASQWSWPQMLGSASPRLDQLAQQTPDHTWNDRKTDRTVLTLPSRCSLPTNLFDPMRYDKTILGPSKQGVPRDGLKRTNAKSRRSMVQILDFQSPSPGSNNQMLDSASSLRSPRAASPQRRTTTGALGCAYVTTDLSNMKTFLKTLEPAAQAQYLVDLSAYSNPLQHARECRAWEAVVAEQKARADAGIQATREKLIRSRLFSLGWGDQLEIMGPTSELARHSLVTKAEVLTDEAWADIAPRLEGLMKKSRRLEKQRDDVRMLKEAKLRFAKGRLAHGRV